MNFSKITTIFAVVSVLIGFSFSDKLYAAAFCITNPEEGLCGVSADVSGPGSVPYNTSATMTLTPGGIFQLYNSRLVCADTFGGGCGLYMNNGYSTASVNINVGPLTSSVTVYYEVEDVQGSYASDSQVVFVSAPPSANIQFSFLETVKNSIANLFAERAFAAK